MSWMAACGLARRVTRVCDWLMVPKTRRELKPHKKEVSSDGLNGEFASA